MNAGLEPYALKRNSASFTLAATLLSRPCKAHVETLYRLCRAIDDAADVVPLNLADASDLGQSALLSELTVALDRGQTSAMDHPWLTEIDALPGNMTLRRRCLLRLAQTCKADMTPKREIADEQALLSYAYGVAGTVGLMMMPILGVLDHITCGTVSHSHSRRAPRLCAGYGDAAIQHRA
jgi:15-cis-phytoene synthase